MSDYIPPLGNAANLDLHVVTQQLSGLGSLYFAAGMEDVYEQPSLADAPAVALTTILPSALIAAVDALRLEGTYALSATAAGIDTLTYLTSAFFIERAGLSDVLAPTSSTTDSLVSSVVLTDVVQQAINQIITDTAAGSETLRAGVALALIDIANAVGVHVSTHTNVVAVAEIIASIELLYPGRSADVVDAGVLTDAYVRRVDALVELFESHYIDDVDEAIVHVIQTATDTAHGTTGITSAGSLITALLSDVTVATIRLNIGGELFTGWVLNTDTLAPSEYQFADRQFNSACKHGDKYLLAAEDGVYEFTDESGVETVMTYIKTGKTDFGSDLKKRIVNSYIVYSASGNMVLKVTTSEYGQLQTRNYRMVPPSNSETTDVRRFDLGRGIKSRYWQFELVGDGVDCDIDEIGMLPIVLSRRI